MPAEPAPLTIETRRAQMFPTLSAADIERLRRFGEPRSFGDGDYLAKAGTVAVGMIVILAGEVVVVQHDDFAEHAPITVHAAGSFMGELAQLSERPALVDAIARGTVRALVIPSRKLRDVLVEEADLGERIMRALILRRVGLIESSAGGPVIVGRLSNPDVLRLQGFLARNGHPYQRLDPDSDPAAQALLERFHLTRADLPIVLCANGRLLRNPSEPELGRCLGLLRPIDASRVYDIAIVGAGPAGLAAAVYAASEGLSVLAVDCRSFGGQAGASSRIENYLGFPTGIGGMALMARAYNQAQKFGVEMAIPSEAVSLREDGADGGGRFRLGLHGDQQARARAIVIASGARYRRLAVDDLAAFEGSSVHYWASPLEAKLCSTQEVALVGAGNSAGQAAVYLATHAAKVWMLVRGASLEATMSRYLVDRIAAQPNIEVLTETAVTGLEGQAGELEAIRWRQSSAAETRRRIRHLFLFIGAEPNTAWLADNDIALDDKRFVVTGADQAAGRSLLETSCRGVFAIGDVRAGSVKRVAAAVGEGAQVIAAIHAYLAEPARGEPVGGGAHG